jgi:hypothetical protein
MIYFIIIAKVSAIRMFFQVLHNRYPSITAILASNVFVVLVTEKKEESRICRYDTVHLKFFFQRNTYKINNKK